MSNFVGHIGEFNINGRETFDSYEERLEMYFIVNKIVDTEMKKALFLTVSGSDLYQLIRSLTSPGKPTEKTFEELIKLVKGHLNPKPNIIVERYKFNSRIRKSGESVSAFIAELRHLSRNCEFKDTGNDMLRDRLVVGINNINIQRKLLGEVELTLEKAVNIAVGMETATREAAEMSGASEIHGVEVSGASEIHGVEVDRTHREKCFRCGDTRHKAPSCFYKDKECFLCKKKGHIAKVCASKKRSKPSVNKLDQASGGAERGAENVCDDQRGAMPEGDKDELYYIYKTELCRESPMMVDMELNGEAAHMELDTGASLTVAGRKQLEEVIGKFEVESTSIKLKTYGERIIYPVGVANVLVKYRNQVKNLPIVVTSEPGPMLFGRNWLRELRIDWKGILPTVLQVNEEADTAENVPGKLQELLEEYKEVFSDQLGTMKDVEVHLDLKEGVKPKYFRARPVPYSLKKDIEDSLDKLIGQGVYESVSHSAWAAPIVPVKKEGGGIRICGDYKLTVNQATECDVYPVPKTEDLLATLNGGERFTKLDLSQAYQQLKLDEESQKLCTINTHKGLFQPTRLQFGIHSASGIFQREMESRLAGIPYTIIRVDDILITGRTEKEHLGNLEKVLEVMLQNGLHLKMSKCSFFKSEVIYLGFRINNEGIEPVGEKVRPVLEAPEPTNTTQLKSFLGMLQYYHRHLPNVASKLEPLHELLRKDKKWEWKESQRNAFKIAKQSLSSSKLLVHYDPQKPMRLAVDASPYGVGAVLSHIVDDEERPIAYASRTLNSAERNYSQIEKEGLAVVYGVKKFHQYLLGLKFQVYTDHKPLLGLLGESKPIPVHSAARIQRWALLLAGYNYELMYRRGAQNANADAMSRLPIEGVDSEDSRDENGVFMVALEHSPVTSIEVKRETERDPVLVRVKEFLIHGWPDELQVDSEFQPYKSKMNELTIEDGCILWGGRVVIPPKLQEKVLGDLHLSHVGVVRMKMLARAYCWWPHMDRQVEETVSGCRSCLENSSNPPSAILHPWETTSKPWSRIHIDHAGPFLGHMFLIVVDSFTKWVDAYVVSSTSSERTIEKLRASFAVQGIPDTIVSDNGSGFTSSEFKEFLKKNGIQHVTSAPYHPATNGAAERTVQSFKNTMKKITAGSKESMDTQIARLLFTFRHAPSSVTGVSPAEMLFKQKPKTRLSRLKPDVSLNWRKAAEKMIESRTGGKRRDFAEGQRVIARSYRGGEKWVFGEVEEKTGPLSYKIRINGGIIR